MRPRAEQKGLIFSYQAGQNLPAWVEADETRLRQVLLNLLSNAVKFTEAGQVTLRVRSRAYEVGRKEKNPLLPTPHFLLRFEMIDTGPGIPASELERIFQPFEQVGELTQHAEGTGLGLTISRQLVHLMGGELQVVSEVGQGSTFSFELPLPIAMVTGASLVSLQPAEQVIVGYKGFQRKLLVVDDIPSNRAVLVDLLQPLGFEVIEAENGQEAIRLAQETRSDLILMDRRMPGMNGLEAAQQLRQHPELQNIPLIGISASVTEADQALSRAVGYDDFLPKPINWPKLTALLEKYLNLEWAYSDVEVKAEPLEPVKPMIPPPAEELAALYELTRLGNMRRIREQAEYLESLGEAFVPFARKVQELAQSFQERAIVALLEQYLKQGEK
jgi:CheY-like chemotaxis protein